MEHEIPFITYHDVLKKIENEENQLLIANGFNYGLGVHTGYSDIFKRMIKDNHRIYSLAEPIIEECGYDLEAFLGKVEEDIDNNNTFLKKYTKNKIKFDFMKALHEIVKEKTNSIYAEKNEGVWILLKQFSNYFSINYDAFLYMLLLKFKSSKNSKNSMAIEGSLDFAGNKLDDEFQNIYSEIKKARDNGVIKIDIGDSTTEASLSDMTKTSFFSNIKIYAKNNNKTWSDRIIKKVIDKIIKKKKVDLVSLRVNDGSKVMNLFGNELEFVFDVNSVTQNLFFLHGAFHIIKDGDYIKKITQSTDKALYEKLEELLNNDKKDIVCVFQSENKLDAIQDNPYLLHCYNKLAELTGNLVIIGSSLDDNDNHIFHKINESEIKNIYVSALKKEVDTYSEKLREKFPEKNLYLFDAETISYEIPDEK